MEIILLVVNLIFLLVILIYYRKSKLYFLKQLDEIRNQNSTIVSDIVIQNQALGRLNAEFRINIKSDFYLGTRWSIYPDALYKILSIIVAQKPNYIVEMGSGASTLYIGLLLKKMDVGKLISLEDNKEYCSEVEKAIKSHGIEDKVDLKHCDLVPLNIGDSFSGSWYDTTSIIFPSQIDLLLVDGPYGHSHDIARYPAYPMLDNNLSDGAVIFLDDGKREGERKISSMWVEHSKGKLHSELFDTYHGLYKFNF